MALAQTLTSGPAIHRYHELNLLVTQQLLSYCIRTAVHTRWNNPIPETQLYQLATRSGVDYVSGGSLTSHAGIEPISLVNVNLF